ncbi:MAG: SagB/ThcOx family dehydrogenase [Bacteroidales bacterium]|nr:MAG: SagB/ThcOx family dehydrogenase [Bacteroidales bacterium]
MFQNTIEKYMTDFIKLPEPQKDLEFPLMKAFEKRRTKRKWQDSELSKQEISNLLWAACGITHKETNRSKSRRTAPSACNSQEIKVYIALSDGVYVYEEKNHQLIRVDNKDIRENIGTQKMMRSAPVGLIYVSDYTRLKTFQFKDDEQKWFTSTADTGFISQNVYLYCAAANLSTVLLGLVNREKLHNLIGLNENEKIVYTQVVGKSLND